MAGISSKALNGSAEKKRGYNGNELQSKEFNDGNGLELYDFNARTYDQQVGRFIQIDPLGEEGDQEGLTTYQFGLDNPVRYDDPDGKCPSCLIGGIIGAAVDYGSQVAANVIEGKSLGESLTDVDRGSIVGSALLGAATSGVSAFVGNAGKAVVTIGVKTQQLYKTQKVVANIGAQVNNAVEKGKKFRNPDGAKGKPDHQGKVKELSEKAKSENPGMDVVQEKKIQLEGSNRRPDVQVVDPKTGKTIKVYEAERKPNSQRNKAREAEYKKLNVPNETHRVGGK
jgi:RHS repeat-associated protein